jgi:hypothetical protein
MSTSALVPTYFAQFGGATSVTSVNSTASGVKGGTLNAFFAGAEPNATFYAYHQQANGIITGLPAGQSPAQAQASGVNKRTSDSSGKCVLWDGNNPTETAPWDVGVSNLFAWIPVGKTDENNQVWLLLPNQSGDHRGSVRFEALPKLVLTMSSTEFEISNLESPPSLPQWGYTVTGAAPNTAIGLDPNSSSNSDYAALPTYPSTDATGSSIGPVANYTDVPGQFVRTFRQVYKGVAYLSNTQTLRVFSPAYFSRGFTENSFSFDQTDGRRPLLPDACWVNNTENPEVNKVFIFWRTVTLVPGQTYTIRCCADDLIWVTSAGFGTLAGNLGSVSSATFTVPAGRP